MANSNLTKPPSFFFILVVSTCVSFGQASQNTLGSFNHVTATPAPISGAETPPESKPNAPTVTCSDNQLTISSNNSTLANVLEEVHKCTGAKIDVPEGAAASRMFDKLGPGPTREVLSSLLTDTGFDYVIGLSELNPEKVESVLLMARSTDTSSPAVNDAGLTPARRAYLLMHQSQMAERTGASPVENDVPAAVAEPESPTRSDSAPAPVDSSAANTNQPPASDQSPAVIDPGQVSPQSPNSTQPNASPNLAQPGNTQDQITNMEKMFEQRRQMIQNQNSQPSQPPQ